MIIYVVDLGFCPSSSLSQTLLSDSHARTFCARCYDNPARLLRSLRREKGKDLQTSGCHCVASRAKQLRAKQVRAYDDRA